MNEAIAEYNSIRQQTILKFWPVAALVLVVYISISFFISKDFITGWILSFNLLVLMISIPVCLKAGKILLACNIVSVLGMLTITPMLITGGPADSGFWLSITYVVGVFLITTKKWAIFWLSVYLFISSTIVLLSFINIVHIAYTIPELLNMLFIYIITCIFVYVFNQVREQYLQIAEKKTRELTRINKELGAANSELEQFAYLTSHDLQEPLRTISNFAGLLVSKGIEKSDPDTGRYLQLILNGTVRMQNLIKDLLEFSRVGRDRSFESVDINIIMADVLVELDGSIKESHATITIPMLPIVTGNAAELKRLFQNLISNAIKFRKTTEAPKISIAAKETETEYLFSIHDNGIGIEEKYFKKLFIIFQRLHSASEYPGTGIGLATCKKIVTMHNGNIWVESKPGEGSTFYFTLAQKAYLPD